MIEWKRYLKIGAVALGVLLCAIYFPNILGLLGLLVSTALPLILGGRHRLCHQYSHELSGAALLPPE